MLERLRLSHRRANIVVAAKINGSRNVSSDIYHKSFPFLLLGIKIIVALENKLFIESKISNKRTVIHIYIISWIFKYIYLWRYIRCWKWIMQWYKTVLILNNEIINSKLPSKFLTNWQSTLTFTRSLDQPIIIPFRSLGLHIKLNE